MYCCLNVFISVCPEDFENGDRTASRPCHAVGDVSKIIIILEFSLTLKDFGQQALKAFDVLIPQGIIIRKINTSTDIIVLKKCHFEKSLVYHLTHILNS